MENAKPAVLTVPEVAQILGLSPGKTYALVGSGIIPSLRLGKSIRVPEHRFREWLNGQSEGSQDRNDD